MKLCEKYDDIPNEITKKLENAPIFYLRCYYDNVLARKQKVVYIWSESFILVVRIKKKFFLKAALLESEPFYYDDKSYENCQNYQQFLTNVMKLLKKIGIHWTITTNTSRFQFYPIKAKVIKSGNFIIDLTLSEEELWSKMHSKHRNSVLRGEKAEMDISFGHKELIETFTKMANDTYARSGIGELTISYYNSIIDNLDDNSLIGIICKKGEPQAAVVFLFSSAIAYYLHGASIRHPEPGSTNYLIWRVMKIMKEKGVKEFSFVGYHIDSEPGSKLDGIQKFKERFGGNLELCYSFKFIQNKFMYNIYCIAMRILSGNIFKKYKDSIDEQIYKFPELNNRVKNK